MKRRTEYLTDKELEKLIGECEKDPVCFPAELSEQLTERIRGSSPPGRRPKESYALYCVKVWLSVAAAVAAAGCFILALVIRLTGRFNEEDGEA